MKKITRIPALFLAIIIVISLFPAVNAEAAVQSGTLYEVTNSNGAPVWTESNSNSTKLRTLSKGSQVTITYTVRNAYLNEFGVTVNGTFVYMGNLKKSTRSVPATGDYVAVKDNVPLRFAPASEQSISATINKDTVVNVRKWYYNDRGNLWATCRVSGMDYEVFSDNIAPKKAPTPTPQPTPPPAPTPTPQPTPNPAPQPAPAPYFSFGRDQYNFQNTHSSFGYSSAYRIPLERYIEVFGQHYGKVLYDSRSRVWGGNCYGMSASALLFHQGWLKQSSYQSGISTTYGLSAPRSTGHSLTKLIEYYQISQFSAAATGSVNNNLNKIEDLVRAVENFEKTGRNPVVLAVFMTSGGHAVIPYKVDRSADGSIKISVWDNNHPNDIKTLSISSNMRTWSYNGSGGQWSSSRGWLTYIPFEVFNMQIDSMVQYSDNLLVAANTPSMITTLEGVSWEDIPGAYRIYYIGNTDGNDETELYSLPADYEYVITPISGSEIDVDIAGDSFHIQTDSSNAEAIIVSPGSLDVIIQSDSDDNYVNLTIGTDEIECNITAVVSGDLQIVEDSEESIVLLGEVQILESDTEVIDSGDNSPDTAVTPEFESEPVFEPAAEPSPEPEPAPAPASDADENPNNVPFSRIKKLYTAFTGLLKRLAGSGN